MYWTTFYKSAAQVATDADEHEQNRFLWPTKDRFFRHLVRRGWNPVLDEEEGAHHAVSEAAASSGSSGGADG